MRYSKISCEIIEFRAAIRLPPPKGGCTIDEDTAAELRDCGHELLFEDSVRVVAITGSGDQFATGRLQPPAEAAAAPVPDRMDWIDCMGAAAAIAKLPMPTIAILNGDAVAHGLEVAMAADLRIAAETARLGMGSLLDCGFPYDGGTQRLPRLVGPGMARDMLFTGRTLSAQEALAAGLVNRVAPADEFERVAEQLARQIASAAPVASRYAKEAVWASGDLSMTQGLRLEADLSVILHSTEDRAEGLRSFAEKRAPQFNGK